MTHNNKYKFILIFILIIFLLSSCNIQVDIEDAFSDIKVNMEERQVVRIMGDDFVRDEYGEYDEYCLIWVNEDDTEAAEVYFDRYREVEDTYWNDEDGWEKEKELEKGESGSLFWIDNKDEETEKYLTVDTDPRANYDEFFERFDSAISILAHYDQEILQDYEFVEEDNVLKYTLEIDGWNICVISLEFEGDYINKAWFAGRVDTDDNWSYTFVLARCLEIALVQESFESMNYGDSKTYQGFYIKKNYENSLYIEYIEYIG